MPRAAARRQARKENAMPTGFVRSFYPKYGYGFIRPDDGSKDLFVHSGAVKRAGLESLRENQRLSYDVRSELDGRRSAVDLKAIA
jgi:cold shock protein